MARGENKTSAPHHGSQLHGVGRLGHPVATQVEDLAQVGTRAIDLRRFCSEFLQLEILDRPPDAMQAGERPLRDDLGDDVPLSPPPEPHGEEEGEGTGEAPLVARQERVGAAVGIGAAAVHVKGQLPTRYVGELAVEIEDFVVDVVQPRAGEQVHEVQRSLRVLGRGKGLRPSRTAVEQDGQGQGHRRPDGRPRPSIAQASPLGSRTAARRRRAWLGRACPAAAAMLVGKRLVSHSEKGF